MKRLMALLLGIMLSAPALAQSPAPPPVAAAANAGVRYAPGAHRLGEGQYRAEVRRRGAAGDAEEIAWSSGPHATMADALREACKMIATVYAPGMPCPVAAPKKAATPSSESKPAAKAVAVSGAKANGGPVSPVSGYQVRGCAFYALVNGRVVQRCPSEGAPGTKPFWYNEDAFEGGYGGWGR
ncbi:MAG TPA: hypothetical protein VFR19_09930 [Hyphomicrobiaceae bacterium]|nr:hypothetical protein [Hyphomicrobiaceae bacterium]